MKQEVSFDPSCLNRLIGLVHIRNVAIAHLGNCAVMATSRLHASCVVQISLLQHSGEVASFPVLALMSKIVLSDLVYVGGVRVG